MSRLCIPESLRIGRGLQVRAESQQTAVAILDHELAAAPGHVAKSASEFHASRGVLGVERVGIFDEQIRGERRLDVVESLDIAEAIGINPYRFLAKFARRPQQRRRK